MANNFIIGLDISLNNTGVYINEKQQGYAKNFPSNDEVYKMGVFLHNLYLAFRSPDKKLIIVYEDNLKSINGKISSAHINFRKTGVASMIGAVAALNTEWNEERIELCGVINNVLSSWIREQLKKPIPDYKNSKKALTKEQWEFEREYLGLEPSVKVRNSTKYKKAVSKKYYEEQKGERLENDNITDAFALVEYYKKKML